MSRPTQVSQQKIFSCYPPKCEFFLSLYLFLLINLGFGLGQVVQLFTHSLLLLPDMRQESQLGYA